MSACSSVSPPLPTTTFFSILTPDALDVAEACAARARALAECPSAAAPDIPRRLRPKKVRRTIGRLLDIGGLYNGHLIRDTMQLKTQAAYNQQAQARHGSFARILRGPVR